MSPIVMCLSGEVDLFAAFVIGAIGVDALRHVSRRRQLALAVIPLMFAFHQLMDAGVWWSLTARLPELVGSVSAWLYLAIALVIVPILVPLAVRSVEPNRQRRRWMTPFLALGVVVGIILGVVLVAGPVRASIGGHFIDYRVGNTYSDPLGALYIAAVAVPLLMSTDRRLVWLGGVNLVIVSGLAWLLVTGLVSLWCAAAAVQSVVIAHYLRTESGDPWKFPGRLRSLLAPLGAR